MTFGNEAPKPKQTHETQEVHSVMICPSCEFSSMQKRKAWMHAELNGQDLGYVLVTFWKCRGCGWEEPEI